MTKKTTMKLALLSVAALGLALTASAQTDGATGAASTAALGPGLLGQTYTGLTYSYTDIQHTSLNNQGLRFVYNEPVAPGLDALFTYQGDRSARFAGTRNTDQMLEVAGVAYMSGYGWAKPYVSAGAGYLWTGTWGMRHDSFEARFGTGVEFLVARNFELTPYVNYTAARALMKDHRWNYGVSSNYWLTRHWGVSAALDRDNLRNMAYSVGVNFRF